MMIHMALDWWQRWYLIEKKKSDFIPQQLRFKKGWISESRKIAKDLVILLPKSGFNLTKFVSNINHLPLPAELQHSGKPAPTDEKVIPKPDESSHVLGLKQSHTSDTLVVSRGTTLIQTILFFVFFLRGKLATAKSYTTEIAFVFGKARVAPMKALTIPKLELFFSLLHDPKKKLKKL